MNSLPLRVLSAAIAALIILATGYWGGAFGLSIAALVVTVLALNEFSQIAFNRPRIPSSIHWIFLSLTSLSLMASFFFKSLGGLELALPFCFFVSLSLLATRNHLDNEDLLVTIGAAAIGFIYCLYLPGFVFRLLNEPDGIIWFSGLLIVVFAGDTFAYFGGYFWGKAKLMEAISPKKTVAGAISGLLGSVFFGLIFFRLFKPDLPLPLIGATCLVTGILAQSGDLLASLIKRVGKVKDSGKIMPGHGGVLDRIDGVFLSAPVFYCLAASATSLLK